MLGAHAGRLAAPGFLSRGRAWLRACVPALRISGLRKTAAAVAAGAPIGPGERVMVSMRQVSGALVAATAHAVYRQDGTGTWSRLGWEDVDQVFWDRERCPLSLTRVNDGGSPPVVLGLPRGTPLVELARDRVTATTLARAPLLSGGRVCAARAAPSPAAPPPITTRS
jgi:hypothetical protein